MNRHRVEVAAQRIEVREKALAWFAEHSSKLTKDDALVKVTPLVAGNCEGADQAMAALGEVAGSSISDLVMAAISKCHDDIEAEKVAIRHELEK